MNKLEKKYADNLELKKLAGEILDWRFEPIRLRLTPLPLKGEKNPFYKPDFLVVKTKPASGMFPNMYFPGKEQFEFHETKGFWRPVALNRIKVAASLYPWFRFIAVMWDERAGWQFREFKT